MGLWPFRGIRSACAKDITCGVALHCVQQLKVPIPQNSKVVLNENLAVRAQQQKWTIVGFLLCG